MMIVSVVIDEPGPEPEPRPQCSHCGEAIGRYVIPDRAGECRAWIELAPGAPPVAHALVLCPACGRAAYVSGTMRQLARVFRAREKLARS